MFTRHWLMIFGLLGWMSLPGKVAFGQTEAQGTVVQDTFLRAARPDEVYGFNATFLSGNDPAGWRTDGLVQFDLPALPAGQQVQSASLELFNNQLEWANRGSAEFEARAIMSPWEEEDTWSTLDADDPTLYGETVYDSVFFEGVDPTHGTREDLFPDEWMTWDVTELVKSWYDGSIENNGVAILGEARFVGAAQGGIIFPQFRTLDYFDDESLHPTLNITFASGGGSPALQPGDADQDLDFDQLDLVKVQVAAKYLTGEAATWGEGDWDGAPGGQQGSPPAGNGLFDQGDIVKALAADFYLKGPYAAIKPGGAEGDDQTSLVYQANTGELSVDAPAGKELTSINITSDGNQFIGDQPAVLDGAFDNFGADNIFKATFGGSFGSISFGNVLPAGVPEADLVADLSAVGSLAGGGDLGDVDLIYIPEPATFMLLGLSILSLIRLHRFRRT